MSAASTPPPRSRSYSDSPRPAGPRHSLFWPVLIFLFGAGSLSYYQVLNLEDRIEGLTQAIDKMDAQVKRGQYEKSKFFAIARDVLVLSAKNPSAHDIATFYKLKELQEAQPELMALSTAAAESPVTNAPPADAITNAAPEQAPTPAPKP